MTISEIKDKNIWEGFLSGHKEKTFLNSWNWGEFQKMMNNRIWRFGIFKGDNLTGLALVSKIKAKRGTFLLLQHGPVVENNKSEILKTLLNELRSIAKKEKAGFVRMNPLWERDEDNLNIFRDFKFKESPMHASAYEATWKLDIQSSEEDLLMNMRKTTRYLIRQAIKNQDITIEKSSNLNDIELYQKLNKNLAQRQNFVPFSSEFIKNEFEVFSRDNQAVLLFGKYKNELAATSLVIFWQGIAFYHQAASDSKFAKFSVPYLLSWETIKEAKKRGCLLYDFWGFVDPQKNPKHPWAGPTLFKMGFGGYKKEYVKTQDFPFSNKYWLTYFFEKIRKTKRGL